MAAIVLLADHSCIASVFATEGAAISSMREMTADRLRNILPSITDDIMVLPQDQAAALE
jgi:hypothetical protein